MGVVGRAGPLGRTMLQRSVGRRATFSWSLRLCGPAMGFGKLWSPELESVCTPGLGGSSHAGHGQAYTGLGWEAEGPSEHSVGAPETVSEGEGWGSQD